LISDFIFNSDLLSLAGWTPRMKQMELWHQNGHLFRLVLLPRTHFDKSYW